MLAQTIHNNIQHNDEWNEVPYYENHEIARTTWHCAR